MGEVVVHLRLENASDRFLESEGSIQGEAVRFYEGVGVVDTGAIMLAIPKDVAETLGLRPTATIVAGLADGSRIELPTAGPVDLTVAGRIMSTDAIVLPPDSEILIGQTVLERLDLLVDCPNQTLIPRPESPIYPLIKLR